MVCKVIVDVKAKQVNRTFDYQIPANLYDVVEVGSRVIVPFGPRLVMGFVIEIVDNSEYDKLKNVKECLDVIPVLNAEMIELAKMIATDTSSFLVQVLDTMIPSSFKAKYQKRIKVIDSDNFIDNELITKDTNMQVLKKDVKAGKVEIIYDYKEKGSIKTRKFVRLINHSYNGSKKQMEVIEELKKGDLIKSSLSTSIVTTLEKKNVIEIYDKQIYREIESNINKKHVILNDDQNKVYKKIYESINENKVFLLKGVTGSGKTEVYLEIIERAIENNKEAIMLVPEISLTPMMVSRFKGRFNDNVAVLHSGLSMNEKYDEYRRILNKEVKIVVGARSAIFAPFKNLGIIIIDEEHEESYIQDVNPRYNAIDVANYRAKYHNIPLILGSATPSVKSYTKALNGEYELLKLDKRANNAIMPKMHLINMADELKQGNKSPFSMKLKELINDRLEKKEQSIILLNRRGYSNFVICRDCGYTITCPNCSITLTYHKNTNSLKCHYCGHEESNVIECPNCHSGKIRFMGNGTEQLEEVIKNEFNARVVRMDLDTTQNKNSHKKILDSFMNQEYDILVGTQMIAKGLDFPNVTLVGVINADMILKMPNYDNSEKTFELISQVSGRAGRHNKPGEVVVQGYNVDHYSIKTAIKNDYDSFYKRELEIRKLCNYPPYKRMTKIMFQSINKEDAIKEAAKISKRFKDVYKNIIILGPTEDNIPKMADRYRINILLKYDFDIKDALNKMNSFYQDKEISISIIEE